MSVAEVRELPGICTVIGRGENPVPIIDDFLAGYFDTLQQIGQLEAVLGSFVELGSEPVSWINFQWDWHLVNENRRLRRENA